MQKCAVGGALSFLQDVTGVVILVAALEPNATIRPRNFSGREATGIVELITNRLANLAIRICCSGHSCVLRVIEVVNGA